MDEKIMNVKDFKTAIERKFKNKKNVAVEATITNFLLRENTDKLMEEYDFCLFLHEKEKLFNRKNFAKRTKYSSLLYTRVKDCVINSDILYPITRVNQFVEHFIFSFKSVLNTIISSNYISTRYIVNRKSLIGYYSGTGFKCVRLNEIIDIGDKIKLNPFQIEKYPNGKRTKEVEYEAIDRKQIEANYLYFINDDLIFRTTPIAQITLDDNVLEHKDFIANCWTDIKENCLIYYLIELIERKDFNIKLNDKVNDKHPINDFIYHPIHEDTYYPTKKLEKMLNAKKLTETEIDYIFNPKVSAEPPSDQQKSLISDSDTDSETETETKTKTETEIKTKTKTETKKSQVDLFNLQFSYNKYFIFNNETDIIEHSVKYLYETNDKFKKLVIDYENVRILKPTSKTYTKQRYFNFILSNKEQTIYSPQFHAYLNDNNEIISLTKIENVLG